MKKINHLMTSFIIVMSFILMVITSSCNAPGSTLSNDTVYVNVDQMPIFPGGDLALLTFIAEKTVYPEIAKKDSIQGKVIVRFCVTKIGTVSNVTVLQSVSPEIDDEAIRVIKSLPEFTPGVKDGKIVATWYMVPITFSLK